ncbi:MAG: hypothetical protein H7249_13180 [Chitinophagaceae bacterium]|nr:hypothetical protein [Oligoflexus sp.]
MKRAIACFALCWGTEQVAMAEKQQLKVQLPQKASQEREDYQECLAAVIKKYKAAKTPKGEKKQQIAIAGCRDRYPAASILVECKRQVTTGYKDQPELLKPALKECGNEYRKYSFDAKSAIPIAIRENKAFFAGVGMNEITLMKENEDDETPSAQYMGENFGNFSCSPLYGTMFNETPPEYTLFGNDPFNYSPLRNVSKEAFFKAIAYPSGPKKPASFISKDFGEITLDPKTGNYLNYLPSSYCFFNRKIGSVYEALKVYYLLDRDSKSVIPYFGVGFYKAQTLIPSRQLAEEIRTKLGPNYSTSELKPGVFIISTQKTFEVDGEGDPKNVCQKSNESPYVALVVTREASNLASYSLFANTGNLCRFGDRVASRFLKKKSLNHMPPASGSTAE